ncbi:MAG: His/Gly/Thr/Pro-type tRNA ligase C-terminal domain-containing protein, partial [Stellaceae bacterium]
REALVAYFSARQTELSEDSRRRLDKNPLRILDSKEESDRQISAGAPAFSDYLNDPARDFFEQVCGGLDSLGIAYHHNPRLVRGLDYYTHTAFEFVTENLGAQGTVLGGGRYDGLAELLGGPRMPGVGWAAGIERLSMLIADPPSPPRPIALVPVGAAGEEAALPLAETLRSAGLAVDLGYSGNLARRMRRADRLHARAAVLLGEDELAHGAATVRDLDSGAQSEVPLGELAARLKALCGVSAAP